MSEREVQVRVCEPTYLITLEAPHRFLKPIRDLLPQELWKEEEADHRENEPQGVEQKALNQAKLAHHEPAQSPSHCEHAEGEGKTRQDKRGKKKAESRNKSDEKGRKHKSWKKKWRHPPAPRNAVQGHCNGELVLGYEHRNGSALKGKSVGAHWTQTRPLTLQGS